MGWIVIKYSRTLGRTCEWDGEDVCGGWMEIKYSKTMCITFKGIVTMYIYSD